MISIHYLLSVFFQLAILIPGLLATLKPVNCYAFNGNIYDSMKCLNAIRYYENKHGIPQNLLSSISLIESGRWQADHKRLLPWPWAINVGGQPYFFETKDQAISFIKQKLAQGIKNIDVGCNQINLYHHGDKFANLEQVINPKTNSEYAAIFLKRHYTETKNWLSAVARYHSLNPDLGIIYANKVLNTWRHYRKLNCEIQHTPISVIKEKLRLINKQNKISERILQSTRNTIKLQSSDEPMFAASKTNILNNEDIVNVSGKMLKKS